MQRKMRQETTVERWRADPAVRQLEVEKDDPGTALEMVEVTNRRIGDWSPDSNDHQERQKSKPPRGGFHQGYRRITTRDGVIQD